MGQKGQNAIYNINNIRQTLLKAKYCPRDVAVSCINTHVTDVWRMTLKLNRLLKVIKIHVYAFADSRNTKQHTEKHATFTRQYDLEI